MSLSWMRAGRRGLQACTAAGKLISEPRWSMALCHVAWQVPWNINPMTVQGKVVAAEES